MGRGRGHTSRGGDSTCKLREDSAIGASASAHGGPPASSGPQTARTGWHFSDRTVIAAAGRGRPNATPPQGTGVTRCSIRAAAGVDRPASSLTRTGFSRQRHPPSISSGARSLMAPRHLKRRAATVLRTGRPAAARYRSVMREQPTSSPSTRGSRRSTYCPLDRRRRTKRWSCSRGGLARSTRRSRAALRWWRPDI